MMPYTYVYLLESASHPGKHYTGVTGDLKERLSRHNAGQVSHTSKYVPWELQVAVAFQDNEKAVNFEKYLKSHSGRSFAKKHF